MVFKEIGSPLKEPVFLVNKATIYKKTALSSITNTTTMPSENGQIRIHHRDQYNRHSTLMSAYRHVKEPKFMHCVIREKGEVYKALRAFFGKKEAVT